MTTTAPEPDDWSGFANELAGMPDVVKRLLMLHTADEAGFCRTCTTSGRGTPGTR